MKRTYYWKITNWSSGDTILESKYPFKSYEDAKTDLYESYLNLKVDKVVLCNYTIYETDDSIGVNKFAEN